MTKFARWLSFLIGFLFLCANASYALSVTKTPISSANCTNVTGFGTKAWSRPDRAFSQNNSSATRSLGTGGTVTSNYLKCVNYGFAIPTGAVINGLTISVLRKTSSTSSARVVKDAAVYAVKGGVIGGSNRLHFLAPPAPHLGTGVAASKRKNVVITVELIEQPLAATIVDPSVHLAGRHAERNRGAEAEGLVFADVVVRTGMAALDGTLLHSVQCLQAWDDLPARENADVELAIGHGAQAIGQHFGAAVDSIQALRKTRSQAPLDAG